MNAAACCDGRRADHVRVTAGYRPEAVREAEMHRSAGEDRRHRGTGRIPRIAEHHGRMVRQHLTGQLDGDLRARLRIEDREVDRAPAYAAAAVGRRSRAPRTLRALRSRRSCWRRSTARSCRCCTSRRPSPRARGRATRWRRRDRDAKHGVRFSSPNPRPCSHPQKTTASPGSVRAPRWATCFAATGCRSRSRRRSPSRTARRSACACWARTSSRFATPRAASAW